MSKTQPYLLSSGIMLYPAYSSIICFPHPPLVYNVTRQCCSDLLLACVRAAALTSCHEWNFERVCRVEPSQCKNLQMPI